MKYISKPEAAIHTKLTVAAAVRNAMEGKLKDYMSDVTSARDSSSKHTTSWIPFEKSVFLKP